MTLKVKKPEQPDVVEAPPPECVVNDEPKMHEAFEVGDAAHQGDVMFVRINELPSTARVRENRQLAEGETRGSRHVCERGEVYDCDRQQVAEAINELDERFQVQSRYVGPVFIGTGEVCVTHPEHGDHGFPEGSVIACVYQRVFDVEQREERRSID